VFGVGEYVGIARGFKVNVLFRDERGYRIANIGNNRSQRNRNRLEGFRVFQFG
jgi:hypothetical protein